MLIFSNFMEVQTKPIRYEKSLHYLIRMKEVKLQLFAYYIIVHLENSVETSEKLLVSGKRIKVSGFKSNTKSIASLHP